MKNLIRTWLGFRYVFRSVWGELLSLQCCVFKSISVVFTCMKLVFVKKCESQIFFFYLQDKLPYHGLTSVSRRHEIPRSEMDFMTHSKVSSIDFVFLSVIFLLSPWVWCAHGQGDPIYRGLCPILSLGNSPSYEGDARKIAQALSQRDLRFIFWIANRCFHCLEGGNLSIMCSTNTVAKLI
jgi:hypothetical protein